MLHRREGGRARKTRIAEFLKKSWTSRNGREEKPKCQKHLLALLVPCFEAVLAEYRMESLRNNMSLHCREGGLYRFRSRFLMNDREEELIVSSFSSQALFPRARKTCCEEFPKRSWTSRNGREEKSKCQK